MPVATFAATETWLGQPGRSNIAIGWPGADALTSTFDLNAANMRTYPDTQSIVFASTSQVPFDGQSYDALVVVDWEPGQVSPTISFALEGDLSFSPSGTTIGVAGKIALVDQYPPAGGGAPAKAKQNNQTPEAQAFHGADPLPYGVTFAGTAFVADQLGDLAKPTSNTDCATAGADGCASVQGAIATSPADLLTDGTIDTNTSFELTATLDVGDLLLPSAIDATSWRLEMTHEVPPPPSTDPAVLTVEASGSLTINHAAVDDQPLTFAATAGITVGGPDDGAITLSGNIAGSWEDPFGFTGVTVTGVRLAIDLPAPPANPSITVGGSVVVDGIPLSAEITVGDNIGVGLQLGDSAGVGLGKLTDALGKRFGVEVPALNAEMRAIRVRGTLALLVEGQTSNVTAYLSVQAIFKIQGTDRTATLVVAIDADNTLLALQLPAGLTLGAIAGDAVSSVFQAIPLPESTLVLSTTAITNADIPDPATEAMQSIYCGSPTTECGYDIPAGLTMAANITLPESLHPFLRELWIDPASPLRIEGTLPLVGNDPLALKVELPAITPPDGDTAGGVFREGRLSFEITTGPDGTEFKLIGQVDLALPDECLPGNTAALARCSEGFDTIDPDDDLDLVTFQIDAAVSLAPTGGSVTIGGGLAPGSSWQAPFGVDWLDLEAFRIELKVLFGPQGTGIQFGVRAKARIGTSASAPTVDISAAIQITTPGPAPCGCKVSFGFRVYVDQVLLSDVVDAINLGLPPGDQISKAGLPDAALKNVELMVSSIDASSLCLSEGITISADLWLDEAVTPPTPPDFDPMDPDSYPPRDPSECAPSTAVGQKSCADSDGCFVHVLLKLNEDGLIAEASLGEFEIGPITVNDSGFRLELTSTPSFEIYGGISIAGFAEAQGRVAISSDGFAFQLTISDEAGENTFDVFASANFGTNGEPAAFTFELFLRLDAINNIAEAVQEGFSDIREFFGGEANDIYSFRCLSIKMQWTEGSNADAFSGDVASTNGIEVKVHWGRRVQATGATFGKLKVLSWNFDDDVIDNVTSLLGQLDSPSRTDNEGCRTPLKAPQLKVSGDSVPNAAQPATPYFLIPADVGTGQIRFTAQSQDFATYNTKLYLGETLIGESTQVASPGTNLLAVSNPVAQWNLPATDDYVSTQLRAEVFAGTATKPAQVITAPVIIYEGELSFDVRIDAPSVVQENSLPFVEARVDLPPTGRTYRAVMKAQQAPSGPVRQLVLDVEVPVGDNRIDLAVFSNWVEAEGGPDSYIRLWVEVQEFRQGAWVTVNDPTDDHVFIQVQPEPPVLGNEVELNGNRIFPAFAARQLEPVALSGAATLTVPWSNPGNVVEPVQISVEFASGRSIVSEITEGGATASGRSFTFAGDSVLTAEIDELRAGGYSAFVVSVVNGAGGVAQQQYDVYADTSSPFADIRYDSSGQALPIERGQTLSGSTWWASEDAGELGCSRWFRYEPVEFAGTMVRFSFDARTQSGQSQQLQVRMHGPTDVDHQGAGSFHFDYAVPNSSVLIEVAPAAGCPRGTGFPHNAAPSGLATDANRAGPFTLTIDYTPPANDNLADAETISLAPPNSSVADGIVAQTNTQGATAETGEPQHWTTASSSLWYSFASPGPVGRVRLSTETSEFDTVLAVYAGPVNATMEELVLVTRNDDAQGNVRHSDVVFEVQDFADPVDHARFYVAVDGFNGAVGELVLRAEELTPANDDFFVARAQTTSLEGDLRSGITVVGHAKNATIQLGGDDVWYRLQPAQDVTIRIESDLTQGPPVNVAVWLGQLDNPATVPANADGSWSLEAGQPYLIAVDATDPDALFAFRIGLAGPSNDNRDRAEPISSATTGITTVAATAEPGEPDHGGRPPGSSVWYSWQSQPSRSNTFTISQNNFDTVMAAYRVDSLTGALVEVASNDDANALASEVTFVSDGYHQYLVAVTGFGGAEGTAQLAVASTPTEPTNNDRANAITLPDEPIAVFAETNLADTEPGEVVPCGSNVGNTVWWTWTAPADQRMRALVSDDPLGDAPIDTVLAVYPGDGSPVLCNDDTDFARPASELEFQARAGVTYELQVASQLGVNGDFTMELVRVQEIYVDQSATGNGSGQSWADAFTDLHSAIESVQGDTDQRVHIRVAAGTYRPGGSGQPADRFSPGNVAMTIAGGFPAGGGAPDPGTHRTVLSGDLGAGVSANVVVAQDSPSNTSLVLRGLVVRDGRVGIRGSQSSSGVLRLEQVTVEFNDDAGIRTRSGQLIAQNSLIVRNEAAIEISGEAEIFNTTVAGNRTGGGLVVSDNGDVRVVNSVLWFNGPGANVVRSSRAGVLFISSLVGDSGGSGGSWDTAFGLDRGNNIDTDPRFETPGSNFRPRADSPLLDAGRTVFAPIDNLDVDEDRNTTEPMADLAGQVRLIGPDVDIGAYEGQPVPVVDDPQPGHTVAANAAGQRVMAAVKESGALYTREFTPGTGWGPWFLHGLPTWASADITIDANGVVRLVGVKEDGRLYTRTSAGGQWFGWTLHGAPTWATLEQPAVAAVPGRVALTAMKDDGRLYTRVWTPASGWGAWELHGLPTWSTADITMQPNGILRMVAVKQNGRLYTRTRATSGSWSGFTLHGAPTWDADRAPSIASDGDTVVFAAMKADGRLYTRIRENSSWGPWQLHGLATWESGVVGVGAAGDIWLAGVKTDGRLYTRQWTGSSWSGFFLHGLATWSAGPNPSIAVGADGQASLLAVKADGRLYTRRTTSGQWAAWVLHGRPTWVR